MFLVFLVFLVFLQIIKQPWRFVAFIVSKGTWRHFTLRVYLDENMELLGRFKNTPTWWDPFE